jgi:hypothetical protein
MIDLAIIVHEIAVDGLPAWDRNFNLARHLRGRVAFLFKDAIYAGEPLAAERYPEIYPPGSLAAAWRATGAGAPTELFWGVTHWIALAMPPAVLAKLRPKPLLHPGRLANLPAQAMPRNGVLMVAH